MLGRRLGRRARGDRGTSAVEFAIVVPVLLLILLGILEFAFVMRDYLSVSSAARVREPRRPAAALARRCARPPCRTAKCPVHVTELAQAAADAIEKAGSSMPLEQVQAIWVYKANGDGFAGLASDLDGMLARGCANSPSEDLACVSVRVERHRVRVRRRRLELGARSTRASTALTRVGGYMDSEHPFFTGFFQSTIDIQDRSVMTFEPLKPEICAPGSTLTWPRPAVCDGSATTAASWASSSPSWCRC